MQKCLQVGVLVWRFGSDLCDRADTTCGSVDSQLRVDAGLAPRAYRTHARDVIAGTRHRVIQRQVNGITASTRGRRSSRMTDCLLSLPQCTDRHGQLLRAEREGVLAGVEDDAGDEVVTGAL